MSVLTRLRPPRSLGALAVLVLFAVWAALGPAVLAQDRPGRPVPIHIYTPQMTNDMRSAIEATSQLENELVPHFERLRQQKEDYDQKCGNGASDDECRGKFDQMTDTYEDILAMLEEGLSVLVDRIEAASRSYDSQFNKIAALRPAELFDEISGTSRSSLLPARSSSGKARRPLSSRIRTYLRLIGESGVSQAEQFIHSAADLSDTVVLSRQLLGVVRYQRIGFDAASMLPAEFQRQYDGLMPGVASLLLGEDPLVPPAEELVDGTNAVTDWNDRIMDY